MNELQTIPGSRQHHGVITNYIPAADGMDAHLIPRTLAGHSGPSVTCILLVIKSIRFI